MSVCSPALSQGTHDNLHCYFLLKGNRTSLFATPPPPTCSLLETPWEIRFLNVYNSYDKLSGVPQEY